MTLTRPKRRALIVVPVAVLLAVLAFKRASDGDPLFDHLVRRPKACHVARSVSVLVGQESVFDKRLFDARLRQGIYYGVRIQLDVF